MEQQQQIQQGTKHNMNTTNQIMETETELLSTPTKKSKLLPQSTNEEQVQKMTTETSTTTDLNNEDEEREHLESVCNSFRQYATFMKYARIGRSQRIQSYTTSEQKLLLPKALTTSTDSNSSNIDYIERQKMLQDAELRNQFFFDCMLKHAGMKHSQDYNNDNTTNNDSNQHQQGGYINNSNISWSSQDTMDKVNAVLRSVARDWSKEGAPERAASYLTILDALKRYLPTHYTTNNPNNPLQLPKKKPPRILVPGLGLARLALEIYALGYEVQGNEFSLHMLLASDFILNGCTSDKPFAISPYLDASRNVCRSDDVVRRLFVPDIDPYAAMQGHTNVPNTTNEDGDDNTNVTVDVHTNDDIPDFSVAAGEFVSIYSKAEQFNQWDAVASCFFLDTAPNIIQYIQVIHNLLKPNGLLINFGPLHYHWSGPTYRPENTSHQQYIHTYDQLDERYLQSIELSWEDLREVLYNVGFEIVEERLGLMSRYTADTRSFMNTDYRCVYFVARKTIVG